MQPHKVVMLITVLLLVELAATTAAPRKNLQNSKSLLPSAASLSHCPTKCGDMNISDIMVNGLGAGYPFGIGSGCFRSGLELICNPSTDSPELFLGDNSTRVALISYGYAIVKFNIHVMPRTVNSYNSSWSPDLESSDAVNGMDFYYVVLAWVINDQPTCETAKEDNTTYACVSENSRCTTNRMHAGYTCSCSQNYKGNPYILGGCQEVAKNYQVMDVLVEEGLLQVKMPLNKSYSLAVEDKTYTSTGQWTNLSWVISNIKCQDAKQNQNYACVSTNSACLYTSVAKFGFGTVGYRCKCNPGYQGNPYVEHGCTDVDECSQPSPVCDEMCSNTAGSYKCWKCPSGTDFNSVKRKCVKNGHTTLLLGIIIGISSGIGVLLFAVCIILITRKLKKDEQKRIRKKHFNKNQGLLLQHLISSDENIADKTKVFSLLELETATNNFDPARILGQGGHGTVYKGILLDQRVVAIKRAKLVNASEIN
ncbi:Wall-associated kinase family protein [Rhynchospora pubera]|uniref:Wall-associated kinase family protein n=1 Tax=Rhynchospora pubera TaxID=906938 RepID=A0AAV8BV16_9POAL|nr:Wall-associated kinase family protein [Rhynchospora pubera]